MNDKNKTCINGILLINKPQGLTSNASLQRIKRLYRATKAGHTGSLDPLATGMLPICFGEGTKLCQYLLTVDKIYETTGLLGITTTTGDSEGTVLQERSYETISYEKLKETTNAFVGAIQQTPSLFSALKHQGRPLYDYARKGISIERQPRTATIHSLELTNYDGRYFSLRVSCGKGTYIRNLVEDIGERLGVGAHVVKLHRVYTAGFEQEEMHHLADLETFDEARRLQALLPLDFAVRHFPALVLDAHEALALWQGKIISKTTQSEDTTVRLYDSHQQFLGLGVHYACGKVRVKRLFNRENLKMQSQAEVKVV